MWGVTICFAALGFTLSVSAAEPVSTRDFARKPDFLSAKISPNGECLAVAIPVDDQTSLGILDIKNRKLTAALRFSRGQHVADYWWVGPDRVVVSIANQDGPLDQPRYTGELFAMNADGTQKIYLFGYRGAKDVGTHLKQVTRESAWAFMLNPMRKDPKHALIYITPWSRAEFESPLIERIDVYNGSRKRVGIVPAYPPIDVAADESAEPRFAYGMDTKSNYVLYSKNPPDKDWTQVAHPGDAPQSVELHRVGLDGRSAFLTTAESSGRACLREYRFESRTLTELFCSESGVVGDAIFAFDGSRPIALAHEGGKPSTQFLDNNHPDARLMQSLDKSFGGQRVTVTSKTLDASKLLLRVDGDRNPGDFYLFDRTTKKAEYLISRRGWIDPKQMQPTEPITYKTRDGETIQGYLTAQAGLASKRAPLVLMPHGGPHGIRDYWEWDSWAQFLASRGYAVLQPNYRGSGGYGENFEQAGYRKWGTQMPDDLTDAVRWAVAQGIADPQRVCIFGAGYGGYAALMSAVREPDLYRCAVGFAGVYDLESQSEDSDTADYLMGRNYLKKVLGTDEKVLVEQSPVTYIEKLKVPVLIAHGTADKRVPFSQAKLLRKALEKHGKPYEWLEFDGEEHGFYKDENHEAFLNKLAEFLDKHIGSVSTIAPGQANSTGGS